MDVKTAIVLGSVLIVGLVALGGFFCKMQNGFGPYSQVRFSATFSLRWPLRWWSWRAELDLGRRLSMAFRRG